MTARVIVVATGKTGPSGPPTSFDFKGSVRVATTANITLSGAQTIDGVAVIAGNRVLVKDQSTASQNGLYVAAAGAWARAADADATGEVSAGLTVSVEEGTVSGGRAYILSTPNPIVVGTTALTFSMVNAGDLKATNNLSELTATAATARSNIGAETAGAAAAAVVTAAADATTKANAAQAAAATDATTKANAAQAFAIQRGNHSGSQLAATISDFNAAVDLNAGSAAFTAAYARLGSANTFTQVQLYPSGTAALPSVGFSAATTTGLFFPVSGTAGVGIATAAAERARFTVNGLVLSQTTNAINSWTPDFTRRTLIVDAADIRLAADAGANTLRIEGKNLSFGPNSGSYGGATRVIYIQDVNSTASTNPVGGGLLYSEAGALKWRGSGGNIATMGPASADTGWAVSNVTPDKVFDANATSTDELADVLGTLITLLIARGVISA